MIRSKRLRSFLIILFLFNLIFFSNFQISCLLRATKGSRIRSSNSNPPFLLEWYKTLGGTSYDYGWGIANDSLGNVYIAGYTLSYGPSYDIIIAKYNYLGEKQWEKIWGGISDDYGRNLAIDSLGNIYVIGDTYSYGSGGFDIVIIKYNSMGQQQWNRTCGGIQDDHGREIAIDSVGNLYIVGWTNSYGSGQNDIVLVKYNNSGQQQWFATKGGTNNDEGYGLVIDSSDNIYVVGETRSYGAENYDLILVKYDGLGNQYYTRTWGGSDSDWGYKVKLDSSDNIYIVGVTYSYGAGDADALLVKYNNLGTFQWYKTWGYNGIEIGRGILVNSSNSIYIVGYSTSYNNVYDFILLKYNNLGELQWNKVWGGSYDDYGRGITMDSSNNIYLVGVSYSYGMGGSDILILKYGPDSDNDGLTYDEETYIYLTDPNDVDSDDDLMPDGWEVLNGLNPLIDDSSGDPDTDNLSNLEEYTYSTNPNDSDSDDDNLNDGSEVNTYFTDPNDSDSDDDNLNDGAEVNTYLTDPNDDDSDDDGLNDGEEITSFSTDPNDDDSDDDGLNDGSEINTYSTDPNDNDSDDDGLTDSEEVITYRTDPNRADTDGDGVSDYDEIFVHNTDPNNFFSSPYTMPVLIGIIICIISISFVVIMSTYGKRKISDISYEIKKRKRIRMEIENELIKRLDEVTLLLKDFETIKAKKLLNEIIAKAKAKEFKKYHKQALEKFGEVKIIEEQKEELIRAKEFEELIDKAKNSIKMGKEYLSEKAYLKAIDQWNEGIHNYELAIKKVGSSIEIESLEENIKLLKAETCKAYVKDGDIHNQSAKRFHKQKNLDITETEWNQAKESIHKAIEIARLNKVNIDLNNLEIILTTINLKLQRLNIEKIYYKALDLQKRSISNDNIREARNLINKAIEEFSLALNQCNKKKEFQDLKIEIDRKISNALTFQKQLKDKWIEDLGIKPITGDIKIKPEKDLISKFTPETGIEIKREYEFIGGKVRFKTSFKNNTGYNITDVNINYNIPEALKWIINEPKYERKGDSVIISKIGKDDTKSISLYLEPINCVESSINATISYFDIQNKPIAIPMKPKKISITCPIFFTEEEVNLARVKNLHNSMSHCDKKIFPIIKIDKLDSFFNAAISVLKTHDIKLINKEFIEEEKIAEAWFYGLTKVKKNRVITHIFLDGVRRIFLFEVSGDSEEQITAFLAEIGSAIREKLIDNNILSRKDKFWDINISVLSYVCPYCYSHISSEFVQKYLQGESFKCKDCGVYIPKSEIKKVVDKIEKLT